MIELVKRDILKILIRTLDILKEKEEKDIVELKELSNHTIHNASIFQDRDSVSIAILIYSLSKIIERKGYIEKRIDIMIKRAKNYLERDNFDQYNKIIKELFKAISNIDMQLKLYIQEVIDQAQIKKGTRLYEHGISMAQAANILGISQWELMGYIGKTKIIDVAQKRTDIKERLKFTKNLFNVK